MLLGLASLHAAGQGPATPIEQFKALMRDYDRPPAGRIDNDEDRLKYVGKVYQHRSQVAGKFLELAQKHPNDPVAFDALVQAVWQVNTTPWPVELVGADGAREHAFAILQRKHIDSSKLGPLCERVAFGFCQEYESFLRAVIKHNPHREVQGRAHMALAHFLNNRLQRLEIIRDEPKLAKEFADLYGKEYLQTLERQDRVAAGKEAETLLERAADKFGDVALTNGGTVRERARAVLFEIRNLSVGKVAPEIDAVDQDGIRFKLSDYRGKVVLLDFWHQQ